MSTFARSVGRNLRRTRQAAGLTKRELAERAGLDWTVVVAYEGGHGVPVFESVAKIAVALGVSPCELLPGLEWDPKGELQAGYVLHAAYDQRHPNGRRKGHLEGHLQGHFPAV